MPKMKTPIVITAFGTTTKAMDTYDYMDRIIRERFSNHKIKWAYSSRMVRDFSKRRKNIDLKSPQQVLSDLVAEGYPWSIVQSLHLLCGHEFYRLVQEVKQSPVRTSMGLPLLSGPEDYEDVVNELGSTFPDYANEAVVLVGHGTDHPAWSSYMALHHMFREKFGPRIFMGVVEGYPSRKKLVEMVKKTGFKKVLLIPFMIVAGVHFIEDLSGEKDSWKTAFEEEQILVSIEKAGLGFQPSIIDILCRHIQEALNVIPLSQKING